jgi:5-methylcytosine-specific restriction endonuclease McrA
MSVVADVGTSLRAAVVESGERWGASQYRLVQLVAELDASHEWTLDRSPTCAHWVADALDIEVCTAREWVRIGRALTQLDVIDEAFAHGRLSYSKVRVLTRVASVETQAELCELAERVPAGRLRCALASWQARRETPAETEARQHAARQLTWWLDADGMIAGTFRLPPVEAAVMIAGVDAKVRTYRPDASADASHLGAPRWPTLAQQRADALVDLIRSGGARVAAEVIIHVRGDGCTLDDGSPIAGTIVERIAPASFLRALIHDAQRRPIDASGRRRHPSTRQKRVVHERDRACVNCGATDLLEYDHDPDYEQSRRTIIDELKSCCWMCHYRRHAKGSPPRCQP